jgi:hypothetical protein
MAQQILVAVAVAVGIIPTRIKTAQTVVAV